MPSLRTSYWTASARAAAIRDRLNAVMFEPFAGEGSAEIWLVLVVGLQDLDWLAIDLAAVRSVSMAKTSHRLRTST